MHMSSRGQKKDEGLYVANLHAVHAMLSQILEREGERGRREENEGGGDGRGKEEGEQKMERK